MSALVFGIAVAWLVFVLLHRLLTGRFWLWLLPDLIPPVSYLAVPVLLSPLALITPWCLVPLGAALVAGAGHAGLNLVGRGTPVPAGAIRVVSWNTEYWSQVHPPDRLYAFLRSCHADVYLLQERIHGRHTSPREVEDLPRLRAEFPDHEVATVGELVTLSRFPIVSRTRVPGPWRCAYDSTKVLRTDLRIAGTLLSVYNVHIPAQWVRGDSVLIRRFYPSLRARNARRQAQFRVLHEDLVTNPHPVLVSGDFNTTGAMGELRRLRRRLSSANRVLRHVLPWSWSTRGLPLWQLDWTFTAGVGVHRYRLLDPCALSDHRLQELLITVPEGPTHA